MIVFLPNCRAPINFTRFIFKSFSCHVCSLAHFSKAGMCQVPQQRDPAARFLQIVAGVRGRWLQDQLGETPVGVWDGS